MNYCTFPQRPPWGQKESGREESRGKIGKTEIKGKATLTSSTVSLTVRELLMLLYRYDVDLVSLHKFLRKPYLRLGLLLLKKDDNSDKAEEEIEEELKRTSEIRSLAIKESTELFLMLECLFATGSWTNNYIVFKKV